MHHVNPKVTSASPPFRFLPLESDGRDFGLWLPLYFMKVMKQLLKTGFR